MSGGKDDEWGCIATVILLGAGAYWLLHTTKSDPPPVQSPAIIAPYVASSPIPTGITPGPSVPSPPPSPPKPNYDFEDHGTYGYIAAISEEDAKKGRAAGNVLLFRYAGVWNGLLHIEQISPTGVISAVSECPRNCKAIKTWRDGTPSLTAYTPSSMIGAAFDDAIQGRLRLYRQPRPVSPPPIKVEPEDVAQLRSEAYDNEVANAH